MLVGYKRGQASIVIRVKLLDSSVSTGAGKTGLTFSSSGLIISTIADNEATATAYTQAGSTTETITTLGTFATPTATKCRFKEVDATNHKGVYEIQIADARWAVASAKSLLVSVSGVTNLAECDVVIPLRDLDPYDAVRAGLTALPNAAAEAAGGLYTRGTGAGQINQPANGMADLNLVRVDGVALTTHASGYVPSDLRNIEGAAPATHASGYMPSDVRNVDGAALGTHASGYFPADLRQSAGSAITSSGGRPEVNATHVGGTSQTGRDLGASVLLSSGTSTGQLDFTSGVVKANLAQVLGTALTETAGLIAAGIKKFFNVATPTGTVNSIPDAVAGASNGLALVGSAVGAAASVTGAVGSVTGAVGSVTGAVGSVAGNVGGNVVGSVASVTGAVGSVTGAVGSVAGNVGGNVVGSVASVTARVTADVDRVDGVALGTHGSGQFPADVRQILGTASAGTAGYVGPDWGHVNAPTTTVGLSGTTVKTATDVATDTAAIKAKTDNLPTDPADESLIIAATDAIMTRLGSPAGASLAADILGVADNVTLLLGLSKHNVAYTGQTYDGDGNLTDVVIEAYDSAAHALTHDGSTGLIATWALAGTYSGPGVATLITIVRTA